MRGILGSGKRDVHEIEILGRNLTWTEEGLEYGGSDKHRRALLEGLGLSEESKAVNSAAVKPEEISQEEDTEMLEASETERFRSLAATLNYLNSKVGRAIRREGGVHEDGESDSRQLQEAEEGRQILEKSGESDVGDEIMET